MFNPYDVAAVGDEGSGRAAEFMEQLAPRQSRIFGYIFALVPNSTDAHDLYQQTVLALWRKFDQFEPGTNFTSWALKTAHFEVLTYRRASARNRTRFSDELVAELADSQWGDPAAEHAHTDRFAELQDCMNRLKPADRELVERCYRESTPVHEIARLLGRSSQSVCNSLRRIRTALLKCIDQKHTQEGMT